MHAMNIAYMGKGDLLKRAYRPRPHLESATKYNYAASYGRLSCNCEFRTALFKIQLIMGILPTSDASMM